MQKIRNSFNKLHLWATAILTPQFSVHGLTAHFHTFMLKSICCIQFGNGVHNGTISVTYWGFLNDYYMVNPIAQWKKILVTVMGIEHVSGPCIM